MKIKPAKDLARKVSNILILVLFRWDGNLPRLIVKWITSVHQVNQPRRIINNTAGVRTKRTCIAWGCAEPS